MRNRASGRLLDLIVADAGALFEMDFLVLVAEVGLQLRWVIVSGCQWSRGHSMVIREVSQGKVRGEIVPGSGVARFLGVPYGAEVAGGRRFLPPRAPSAWSGVRDSLGFGPAAPQPFLDMGPTTRGRAMQAFMDELAPNEPQGENCLVLNVWAPSAQTVSPRPVMVWIHGGAHTVGSGAIGLFDGSWLAEHREVIVVTINHRLGALGYLFLGELLGDDYASSGNVGNLDIVAGLAWVRDNIGAFGGDAGNVTIFGESGGGAKVSALLAMPAATGLFHRAIIQSGPKLTALSQEFAAETSRKLLEELGLGTDQAAKLLEVPTDVLIEAQVRTLGGPLGSATQGGRPIGPVVDGIVLPAHPFEPVAPPSSVEVPLLIGTNKDEMTLFAYSNEALDTADEAVATGGIAAFHGDRAVDLYATYRRTRPDATPSQRLVQALTDRLRIGSIRIAERKAALEGAPVWMYRFDLETDVLEGKLGAPHMMEIPFVFGVPDAVQLTGTRPERRQLADLMSGVWTAFARTGNPQTDTLPTWPPYNPKRRATMLFDTESHVVDDPERKEREAWDGLAPGI